MKGLLLKDFYMMTKYCRSYIWIAILFLAISFVNSENMFFTFYPCLLVGMIPVNLLAYDEKSRWLSYSGALPYTKAQIVSGKYIIGLFVQIIMLLLTAVALAVRMVRDQVFHWNSYLFLIIMLLLMSMMASSISLPFMFKWGVEKGRMAYYITIGVVCGGSVVATSLFQSHLQEPISIQRDMSLLGLLGVGIYALSWYLSIVFYKKRELV